MNQAAAAGRHKRRLAVDRLTRWLVRIGGSSVIVAIGTIFFYLLWVVFPLFADATIGDPIGLEAENSNATTNDHNESPLRFLTVDEGGDAAYRIRANGSVEVFSPETGHAIRPPIELLKPVGAVQPIEGPGNRSLIRFDDGTLLAIDLQFPISFANGVRHIDVNANYPFGETPFVVEGMPADAQASLVVNNEGSELMFAAIDSGRLRITHWYNADEGFPPEFPDSVAEVPLAPNFDRIVVGPRGKIIYAIASSGRLAAIDINTPSSPQLLLEQRISESGPGLGPTAALTGGHSILISRAEQIEQWFLVRRESGTVFERIRSFELPAPARMILTEKRRKGFFVLDQENELHGFYATSNRYLGSVRLAEQPQLLATSARGDVILTANGSALSRIEVHNEHPEVSWSSLWQKVWYEGYQEPVHSWQSSSADNEFEPKFGLAPLAFGTMKGALYAMLFALPIAVLGAMYTGFFMSPRMRAFVKPGIEIMAALPTVILGFIAGLWLAPTIEANLASTLSLFLVIPLGVLLVAWLWHWLPRSQQEWLSKGWHGAILLLPLTFFVWVSFQIGDDLERVFFAGDLRTWIETNLGLRYDQRNSLVVGFAMGLAVIPTIFSIAEDAIYGVPRHLVQGSLALGATTWQTMTRVVLLTASPGIFSAAMIGLGRAVGETMIVLMATGNTPIMDLNIFEGMRTFAANIAVELPESEVDSTHFRILFLAALVLFAMTFVVNTIAELVRQRLRTRYGNL